MEGLRGPRTDNGSHDEWRDISGYKNIETGDS